MSRKFASAVSLRNVPPVHSSGKINTFPALGIEGLDSKIAELNTKVRYANQLRATYMEAQGLGLESIQTNALNSLREMLSVDDAGLGLEEFLSLDLEENAGLESGIGGFFKSIWDKIMEFFTWIWNKITGIFKSSEKSQKELIKNLDKSEENLDKAVKGMDTALKNISKKAEITSEIMVNRVIISDAVTAEEVIKDATSTGIEVSTTANSKGYLVLPSSDNFKDAMKGSGYGVLVSNPLFSALYQTGNPAKTAELLETRFQTVIELMNRYAREKNKYLELAVAYMIDESYHTGDYKKVADNISLETVNQDLLNLFLQMFPYEPVRDAGRFAFGDDSFFDSINIKGTFDSAKEDLKLSFYESLTESKPVIVKSEEALKVVVSLVNTFKVNSYLQGNITAQNNISNGLLETLRDSCQEGGPIAQCLTLSLGSEGGIFDYALHMLIWGYGDYRFSFDKDATREIRSKLNVSEEIINGNRFLRDFFDGKIKVNSKDLYTGVLKDYLEELDSLTPSMFEGMFDVWRTPEQIEKATLIKEYSQVVIPKMISEVMKLEMQIQNSVMQMLTYLSVSTVSVIEKVAYTIDEARKNLVKAMDFKKS